MISYFRCYSRRQQTDFLPIFCHFNAPFVKSSKMILFAIHAQIGLFSSISCSIKQVSQHLLKLFTHLQVLVIVILYKSNVLCYYTHHFYVGLYFIRKFGPDFRQAIPERAIHIIHSFYCQIAHYQVTVFIGQLIPYMYLLFYIIIHCLLEVNFHIVRATLACYCFLFHQL